MTEFSAMDAAMLMKDGNKNGFCGEQSWIWIFLFFILFGFGRNGFGGNGCGAPATQQDVANGFNDNQIQNKLSNLGNGICDSTYALNTAILNGFNGVNQTLQQARFDTKDCCCETNRNIDSLKYENSRNTCAITTDASANTQRILDKLCSMEANAKDAQIAALTQQLSEARLQVSQGAQSDRIINTLRPVPQPAYITCSPYQASTAFYNGCGGTCGCGTY